MAGMPNIYRFTEGDEPIVTGHKPNGWTWVLLQHSKLPGWRRRAALLADGRVVIAALNAIKTRRRADHEVAIFSRPTARAQIDGHDYIEVAVAIAANRNQPEQIAHLEAIADLVRATVEGRIEVAPVIQPAECPA